MKTYKWINFKELKEKLNFNTVLEAYGVELRRNGHNGQCLGFCPLPCHDGQRKSPSFSVNLDKGIFHCFGCQAKGNVIEFAALMDGLDPEDGKQFRHSALALRDRFLGESVATGEAPTPASPKAKPPLKHSDENETNDEEKAATNETSEFSEVLVNAPLDFALKSLKRDHPYLKTRGLTDATCAHFGIGYASRGSMKGRIAIPIHNRDGELVGYTGRLADDEAIDEDHPKYLFPSKRERDGVKYEFRKSDLVYNLHRVTIEGPVDELIVVEGAFDVMWLWQQNSPHAVALLGSSCSDAQAEQIIEAVTDEGRIWIFTDGDEPGSRAAAELLMKLASHRLVSWIPADSGMDPCDYAAKELARLFTQPSNSLRHAS